MASFNDYVTCPYNKTHLLLRGRLTKHLERCSRNSDNSNKLLVCPFNENHRYNAEELSAHIKECAGRETLERQKQTVKPTTTAGQTPSQPVLVECEEDWDNEPDVPTYDPRAYCEGNLIVRSSALNGQSKTARRIFRANERRRFADIC